jgi:signal transduction histidine kinase
VGRGRAVVEAADAARRRLERDLHDGAQQRFVNATLLLQLARAGDEELFERVAEELKTGLTELRDLAHGLHPTLLTDRGVTAATVRLAEHDDRVEAEVRDDGRGGASLDAGTGLRGLVDRVGAFGGRLELDSPPGGGTRVCAVLPR